MTATHIESFFMRFVPKDFMLAARPNTTKQLCSQSTARN